MQPKVKMKINYILYKKQAGKKEEDVTKQDQEYINEFSRLYTRNKLVDKELKSIKVKILKNKKIIFLYNKIGNT